MTKNLREWLAQKSPELERATPELILESVAADFPAAACSISFGLETPVLIDMIVRLKLDFSLFTLDTGRLFPESYELWEQLEAYSGLRIRAYFPDATETEEMVAREGLNLFRSSVAQRQLCCEVRKVKPLRRALAGQGAWICGLRAEDSPERAELRALEWDAGNGLIRVNPLFYWSSEQLRAYIREHKLPCHPFFAQGYKSIGCAPCTRPVAEHEPMRAGRWWWEGEGKKECGLHGRHGVAITQKGGPS